MFHYSIKTASSTSSSRSKGRVIVNTEPPPALLSPVTVPPWAVTISFTMERHTPGSSSLTTGSNMCSLAPSGKPTPLSEIRIVPAEGVLSTNTLMTQLLGENITELLSRICTA